MAARLKHSKRRSNPTPTSRRPPTRRALATQHEPRRAEHNGDTEGRILDAAHAVFVRHGTAGARMQDIAKEAGVNQALLHYYFRTKDRLAEAVFRRTAGQLFPQVVQVHGVRRVARGEDCQGRGHRDRPSVANVRAARLHHQRTASPSRESASADYGSHRRIARKTSGPECCSSFDSKSTPRSGPAGFVRLPPNSSSSTCCPCACFRSRRGRC